MVTRRDYSADAVAAAKSVLIELVHLLSEYREHTVLIGGWVPELLFSCSTGLHVGSMDIDLALDHRRIESAGYKMIQELLLGRGYVQGKQPFVYYRDVLSGKKPFVSRWIFSLGSMPAQAKDTGIRKYRTCWFVRRGDVIWLLTWRRK